MPCRVDGGVVTLQWFTALVVRDIKLAPESYDALTNVVRAIALLRHLHTCQDRLIWSARAVLLCGRDSSGTRWPCSASSW